MTVAKVYHADIKLLSQEEFARQAYAALQREGLDGLYPYIKSVEIQACWESGKATSKSSFDAATRQVQDWIKQHVTL